MSGRNRFPFTAIQWQELEHQALIFKYMVSGMPIPPDLLFTLKRSLDSSLPSRLLLPQPQHIGWNCFHMGFGRKIDPEPGRCRRTDGKKWRCSKEAYPDSKYCERHMHRGRNRSRKPVEVMTTATTASTVSTTTTNPSKTSTPTAISISSITKNPNTSTFSTPNTNTNPQSISDSAPHHHNHPGYNTHPHHSFLYPHSSRPPGIDYSSQESNTHLLFPDKDYRYGCGMKEVDEHPFFSESSGSSVRSYTDSSSMDDPWQLTMGSPLAHLKQRTCSGLQNGYPFLQLQGLCDNSKQHKQDQYFHVLGNEIKCEMPMRTERDDQPQKVMHHFLDERPRNKDSWFDSEVKSSSYVPNSTTQLSISSHDFFMAHNNDKQEF